MSKTEVLQVGVYPLWDGEPVKNPRIPEIGQCLAATTPCLWYGGNKKSNG